MERGLEMKKVTRTFCQGSSQIPVHQRVTDGIPAEEATCRSSVSHRTMINPTQMNPAIQLLLPESFLCSMDPSHSSTCVGLTTAGSSRSSASLASSTKFPERPVGWLHLLIVYICFPELPPPRLEADKIERDISETLTVTHTATESGWSGVAGPTETVISVLLCSQRKGGQQLLN